MEMATETPRAVWGYKDNSLSWIGDNKVKIFTWGMDEDYLGKRERLMKEANVMARIEKHLAALGADMKPRGFDVEEAE